MFIEALFIIARTWKQSRCPSADEWIRKLWYIYIGKGNGNPLQCSCLGESQGRGSLVGCHLWGGTELDHPGLRTMVLMVEVKVVMVTVAS